MATDVRFFEGPTNRYEAELERLRTPDVARRWRFLMNMPLDVFEGAFRKALR